MAGEIDSWGDCDRVLNRCRRYRSEGRAALHADGFRRLGGLCYDNRSLNEPAARTRIASRAKVQALRAGTPDAPVPPPEMEGPKAIASRLPSVTPILVITPVDTLMVTRVLPLFIALWSLRSTA